MPSREVISYHDELKRAIATMHGGSALWLETVPVKEVFQGETAWDGDVEVFVLSGHPTAKRCYAWGVPREGGKGWDITAVLAVPPITTPELAVKAAIAAYARKSKPQQ